MDIRTEYLARRHLPLLARWLGRTSGAVTPNDLPEDAAALAAWFDRCQADPARLDCLALVYDTPVGLAGLRRTQAQTASLWLLLGETGYNALRTATYVAQRMLDRAFSDFGAVCVCAEVNPGHAQILAALERMGFRRTGETDGRIALAVDRETFSRQKYLF